MIHKRINPVLTMAFCVTLLLACAHVCHALEGVIPIGLKDQFTGTPYTVRVHVETDPTGSPPLCQPSQPAEEWTKVTSVEDPHHGTITVDFTFTQQQDFRWKEINVDRLPIRNDEYTALPSALYECFAYALGDTSRRASLRILLCAVNRGDFIACTKEEAGIALHYSGINLEHASRVIKETVEVPPLSCSGDSSLLGDDVASEQLVPRAVITTYKYKSKWGLGSLAKTPLSAIDSNSGYGTDGVRYFKRSKAFVGPCP